MSLAGIQNLEAGKGNPSLDTLQKLFRVLDIEFTLQHASFDWDQMVWCGATLTSSAPLSQHLPSAEVLLENLQKACLSLKNYPSQESFERKVLAVQSLLVAIFEHYPSFYRKNILSKKTIHRFYPKKITGQNIKQKRIALEKLSQYL